MTTPTQHGQPDHEARIHDIGYRHYSGERLGTAHARRSLFVHSLRGAYGLGRSARSKVLPFGLFAIMAMPAVVSVAIASTVGLDELPIGYTVYPLFMLPIVWLYLALAAPQMVSLDLRYKTIPLYFSRPIDAGDYVAAKVAAMSAALFLFSAVPVTIAYIGGLLAKLGFATQTRDYALGLVLAAVFAVLHSTIALLTAALTPRRGFGVAAVMAILIVPYFAVNAVQAVAVEQDNPDTVGWLGLFSHGSLVDGFQSAFLGGQSQFPDFVEVGSAARPVYPVVIVAVTALCYVLLLRRYRKVGL